MESKYLNKLIIKQLLNNKKSVDVAKRIYRILFGHL